MSRIESRLADLGENLPVAREPVGNYVGCKVSGNTLYVSGCVSRARGEVGTDLDLEQAKKAAKAALLDILSIVKKEIGDLDRIASIEKMNGFVRSSLSFTEQPAVVDGASDLLVALFDDEGHHARTATGVAQLPFGAAVQLELIMRIRDA